MPLAESWRPRTMSSSPPRSIADPFLGIPRPENTFTLLREEDSRQCCSSFRTGPSQVSFCHPQNLCRHVLTNVPPKDFKWPIWLAYPIYLLSLTFFLIGCVRLHPARVFPAATHADSALVQVRRFERFALVYGTLDEKVIGRDRIPDVSIPQLAVSLMYTVRRDRPES